MNCLRYVHSHVWNLIFLHRCQHWQIVFFQCLCRNLIAQNSHAKESSQSVQVAFVVLVLEKTGKYLLDCPLLSKNYCQLFEVNERRLSNRVNWIFHPFEANMGKFLTEELLSKLSREHGKLLNDGRFHSPAFLFRQLF